MPDIVERDTECILWSIFNIAVVSRDGMCTVFAVSSPGDPWFAPKMKMDAPLLLILIIAYGCGSSSRFVLLQRVLGFS